MKPWLVLGSLILAAAAPPETPQPPVTALAFSPDGKSVVVGSQAGLKVLPWPDLDRLALRLPTALDHVHDLAFSPDGKTLAAVGGTPGRRGSIELYSWPEGKLLRRADPCKDLLYAVNWRSDSKAFVTGADQVVRLHEPASLILRRAFLGHSRGVLAVVFLPDGKGLLSAGLDESLRLWDAEKGTLTRTLANHTRPVLGLAVRPGTDKEIPVVASVSEDSTLRIWQPTIGRLVRFVRLKSPPLAIAWSADGQTVLASCKDGQVRGIDPDTVEVLEERRGSDGLAYSLAVATDKSLLVGGQGGQLRRLSPGRTR